VRQERSGLANEIEKLGPQATGIGAERPGRRGGDMG
jgi:hypothetical protein